MARKYHRFTIISAIACVAIFALQAPSTAQETESPARAPIIRTVETQLSAMTSEYADQLHARLTLQERREIGDWHIRGSYSRTATRSGTSRTYVSTARLDSRLENVRDNGHFNVWTGIVNARDRTSSSRPTESTGYHFVSYGLGRHFDARTKGDVGIGLLEIRDNNDGLKPVINGSLTGRQNLGDRLILDSRVLAIQPFDRLDSVKLDSELGISYVLTKELSVRLGWTANNLVRPTNVTGEWDSVVRLTVSFRQTTQR